MRTLGRNLGRAIGRESTDTTGTEGILASSYQHVVLNSSGDCFTCPSIVLKSNGQSFDIRLPVASAGYSVPLTVLDKDGNTHTLVSGIVLDSDGNPFTVAWPNSKEYTVPLTVLHADGGESIVTTAIKDTDGNTHTVAGVTTMNVTSGDALMYVFGSTLLATKGTTYEDVFYTVQDTDGNYHRVTNAVLDSDGNSFEVIGLVGNAWGGQIRTTCGERLTTIDSDGLFHAATLKVKDKDGNLHTVTSAVLDTDGNSFTVN